MGPEPEKNEVPEQSTAIGDRVHPVVSGPIIEPRMDGTTEQQLMWRVLALREALAEVLIADTQDGAWEMAKNGIDLDDYNASPMARRSR